MIQVCISWIWIFISAFIWGVSFFKLTRNRTISNESVDILFFTGICFLTVYAQIFSLFAGVGMMANMVLLVTNVLAVLGFRKDFYELLKEYRTKVKLIPSVIALVLVITIMAITSMEIVHYDTHLYHAQAIRWIEEYGIVPGLGVLHNRLAYNSSFFALQALFSMKFIFGQSLHSVNGLIVLILITYTIASFRVFRDRRISISDFLRIALLLYFLNHDNCMFLSSPGSDNLALAMVFYIIVRWTDYWEEHEQNIDRYITLCLLGIFAITVKLSASMIVIFAFIPICGLIASKDWKRISKYLLIGIMIALPFLVRNVIISGYLLYPYPELDLFNFDWKMPRYTLLFDRNEIKAWGWGLNNVYKYNAPFDEWFPVWKAELGKVMFYLFIANIVLIIPTYIIGVHELVKKKERDFLFIVTTMYACLLLWFLGAPLPRYGEAYLLLVPSFMAGYVVSKVCRRIKGSIWTLRGVFVLALIICLIPMFEYVVKNDINLVCMSDYKEYEYKEYRLKNETIYVPDGGDQIGYHMFPSTPYKKRFEVIELRGDGLQEGFKIKEPYRNDNVTTRGKIDEINAFE